jgi:NAD(P)-dependent dehydrogenase (short-subunit alcohol dehydrogenase family)
LRRVIKRDSREEHEEVRSEAMTTATEQQPPGTKDPTVAFLADDSSYVTGQVWAVNGGPDM